MAGERSSSVPDEADKADEDQAGTNRLELCFALPAHISPVRRWDTLSLRKLNPRRAAALDYYMSHPQIFFFLSSPVTLKFYKPFSYLLQKSELLFFFVFVLQYMYPFGVQSSAASNPLFLSDRAIGLTFKESQRGAGLCMVTFPGRNFWSVFFPRCSREIGGRRTRLWQRVTIIGIISAVIEDGAKRVV